MFSADQERASHTQVTLIRDHYGESHQDYYQSSPGQLQNTMSHNSNLPFPYSLTMDGGNNNNYVSADNYR